MPGNWTPEKKQAQSRKLKEYWKRRKEEEEAMKRVSVELQKPKKPSGFFNSVLGLVKGNNA